MEDAEQTKKLLQLVLAGTIRHEEIERHHPSDIALHFHEHEVGELYALLIQLEDEFAAGILIETQDEVLENILAIAEERKLVDWVEILPTDESAHLLRHLRQHVKSKLLDQIKLKSGEDVRDILLYEEDQVGTIMQKEMVTVYDDETVEMAIRRIREKYKNDQIENFFKAWVIKHDHTLCGEIPLLSLLIADPEIVMSDMMTQVALKVKPTMERSEVANLTLQYDEPSVPVVDEFNHLIGRLTLDDLGEVLVQELEEDIGKMAGTGEEQSTQSLWGSVKQRLPWLFLGLIGGLFMAIFLKDFEESLSRNQQLVLFVPLIASMGGNVGIQSSSIMVRGLATGEILSSDLFSRVLRELKMSMINGGICALCIVLFGVFYLENIGFGVFVSLCLFLIMGLAAMIGTIVPMMLKKCNVEPAYSTGPFITIGNDILGIAIYMYLSNLYLQFIAT